MRKRKERTLKELYDVTEEILKPEITPVLKGSCRIQGPMDEREHDPRKNTETSLVEKRFGRHSVTEKVCMRAESGTCNVCAAPCSSCMHFNRAVPCMELKPEDEFSDETSRGKVASRCSFNEAKELLPSNNRACGDQNPTASETSNLFDSSSCHDSFSENAESMSVTGRSLVISSNSHVASDVGEKNNINHYEEQKGVECHGDNISCISGANNAHILVGELNVDVDVKNVSCSSASVSSFLPEGFKNGPHVHFANGFSAGSHCEIEQCPSKSRRPIIFAKESLQMDPTIGSTTAGLIDPSEFPSSKDFCADNSSEKVQSAYFHSQSGKSLLHNADVKDLEENSCSHNRDEPSECSMEHVESSLAKLATSDSVSAEKSTTHNCNNVLPQFENSKASSSGASMKIYPVLGTGGDMDIGDPPAKSVKCSDLREQMEVSDIQEPPLQSPPSDESNGSDIVEDDVKVCDICGDAGREDKLAICSRCNDGAEHTYCMRIMMDKVPEHDWLCEECQLKEEAEKRKKDKFETVLGASKASCVNERSQTSGGILNSKLSPKLDIKFPDVEANITTKVGPSIQFPSKRHSDNIEVAPAAKRQALETSAGSPKSSSPSKKAALLRESSFKNLDKGKFRPIHRILSSGGSSTNSFQDTARSPATSDLNLSSIPSRLQSSGGSLLKSKSFNALNSKPKIKLVQEDLSQKQKLARNPVTNANETKKEGPVRTISKSLSFKSSPSHSNTAEPKVKVLPSNISRGEDLRGVKLPKERNLIERKNSFKSDRFLVSPKAGSNVTSLKAEQKIASRGETMPLLSSTSNKRDLKAIQPDGKLNTSSKTSSLLANRGSETPSALAGRHDIKRTLSSLSPGTLSTCMNGMYNSAEQRPSQVSPKDETVVNSSCAADGSSGNRGAVLQDGLPQSQETIDRGFKRTFSSVSPGMSPTFLNGMYNSAEQRPSLCSPKDETVLNSPCTADGPCGNRDAVLQDGLPQSQESINQDKKGRDLSLILSRQGVSAGSRSICCHKCKEIGHAAQFCPNGGTEVLDASGARSSREVMNGISKSKAAVEDALLKRSEIYKNSTRPDQSGDLSLSNTELSCEVASKDQLLNSSYCLKNLTSTDVKQQTLVPTAAVCERRAGCLDAIIPLDGSKLKLSTSDSFNLAYSVSSPTTALFIPEHDYIWQGGFEMQRSEKFADFCDGIQAHLSTCASPKVLEVVNKFPCKFVLEEVPRLNVWPTQFKDCATEDNIALYFFAKDFESYVRSYKSLLENMIKNDLALKGNFDGIELLIFPSNQLPEKSQRWNMLFFLWGVFRGKRVNCAEHISGSSKKLSGTNLNVLPLEQELPTPFLEISQKECTDIHKDLFRCTESPNAKEVIESSSSINLASFSSSGRVDMNCYREGSPHDEKCSGFEANSSSDLSILDSDFLLRIPKSDVQPFTGTKGNGTSRVGHGDQEGREQMEHELFSQTTVQNSCLSKGKTSQTKNSSNCRQSAFPSPDRQETSSGSPKLFPVSTSFAQEVSAVKRRVEGKVHERMVDNSVCEVKHQRLLKYEEGTKDAEIDLECDPMKSDLTGNEDCSREFKPSRKWPCSDSLNVVSQVSGKISTSTSPAMSGKANGDGIFDDGESEYKKIKRCYSDAYCNNNSSDQNSWSDRFSSQMDDPCPNFSENLRTTERYFFPLDGLRDWEPGSSSIPLHVLSSDDEDQLESDVPNLELALGAEKKRPKQEIIPLFAELANKKGNQGKCQDPVTGTGEDELLAPLSLSLAFPFSDQEKSVKPVSKQEQLLPERRQVDTSLILFRGFSDT